MRSSLLPRWGAVSLLASLSAGVLVGCGSGSQEAENGASSSASPVAVTSSASPSVTPTPSVSATPTPTPEPTVAPTTVEVTSEPSEPQKVSANEQEKAEMQANTPEELAALQQKHNEAQIAQGFAPDDPYVKYGEILCGNGVMPTAEELQAMGAKQPFIDWYAQYSAEAPQEVKDMSAANRSVASNPAMVGTRPDVAKCSQYGYVPADQ